MKGKYVMNSFIRDLYDSELSEVNKKFEYTDEAKGALKDREKAYNKLTEKLCEKDIDLLEDYISAAHIIKDDEIFHAYVSGMKDLLRFAFGAFIA